MPRRTDTSSPVGAVDRQVADSRARLVLGVTPSVTDGPATLGFFVILQRSRIRGGAVSCMVLQLFAAQRWPDVNVGGTFDVRATLAGVACRAGARASTSAALASSTVRLPTGVGRQVGQKLDPVLALDHHSQ